MGGCANPGVAVVVVLVAVQAVVGVVAEGLVSDARQGAGATQTIADVVVAVGGVTVLAVLD